MCEKNRAIMPVMSSCGGWALGEPAAVVLFEVVAVEVVLLVASAPSASRDSKDPAPSRQASRSGPQRPRPHPFVPKLAGIAVFGWSRFTSPPGWAASVSAGNGSVYGFLTDWLLTNRG